MISVLGYTGLEHATTRVEVTRDAEYVRLSSHADGGVALHADEAEILGRALITCARALRGGRAG